MGRLWAPAIAAGLCATAAHAQFLGFSDTIAGFEGQTSGTGFEDFVNGTVDSGVWAFSNSFSFAMNGVAPVASPGATLLPNNDPGGFVRDVNVTVATTVLTPTTRQVDITWESAIAGTPFIDAGTNLGGETITNIGFHFGMDIFGGFPGAATNPFEDPDFVQVLSSTGSVFDKDGVLVPQFAGSSGIFTGDYTGGWGGRIFFRLVDEFGNPTGGDITASEYGRYEATVIYEIPAPATLSLLAGTILATRRRR